MIHILNKIKEISNKFFGATYSRIKLISAQKIFRKLETEKPFKCLWITNEDYEFQTYLVFMQKR